MRYKFFVIKKLVNSFIRKGNKFKSINIFLYLLKELKRYGKNKPLKILLKCIRIVKPILANKRIGRGSKSIYLPKLLTVENQYKQGIN